MGGRRVLGLQGREELGTRDEVLGSRVEEPI